VVKSGANKQYEACPMKREHPENESAKPDPQTTPLFLLSDGVIDMHLGRFLEEEDKAVLGATNRYLSGIFKAPLEAITKKLLHHVTHGDENAAEPIAIRNPDLILQKETFIDPAGRIFKNISALQYADWSRDCFMKEMLLQHLPKKYSKEVKKQLNEVKRVNAKGETDLLNQPGIEYQLSLELETAAQENSVAFLDGRTPVILRQDDVNYRIQIPNAPLGEKICALVTVTGEKNHDYQPLLVALSQYRHLYQEWVAAQGKNKEMESKMEHQWRRIVGLVQRFETAFLAQHCCSYDPFNESTDLVKSKFKRNLDFYDHVSKTTLSWFPLNTGLGSDFAIVRDVGGGPAYQNGGCRQPGGNSVERDIKSIISLQKSSEEISARAEEAYFAAGNTNLKPRL
jgi:hypothetical protein